MDEVCVGCGLKWNVSITHVNGPDGYICPHCESQMRSGKSLLDIQNKRKSAKNKRKGAKKRCRKALK